MNTINEIIANLFYLIFYGAIVYVIASGLLSMRHRLLKKVRQFKKFFNKKVRPIYEEIGIMFPEKLSKMNGGTFDEVYVATTTKNNIKITYATSERTHIDPGSLITPRNDTFPYTFFEIPTHISEIKKIVSINKNWIRKVFQRSPIKVQGNEKDSLYIYGHYSNEKVNRRNKDFVNKYFKLHLIEKLQKLPPCSQVTIKPNKIQLRLVGFAYNDDLIQLSISILEDFLKLDFSLFNKDVDKHPHKKYLSVLQSIFESIEKRTSDKLTNINQKIKPNLIKWINGFKEMHNENDIITHISIEPNPTIELKERMNKIEVKITGECEVEFQQKENSTKPIPAGINISSPKVGIQEFKLIFDSSNGKLIEFEEDIWCEHYK